MSTKAIADLWQELGREERLALLEQMAADERKSVQRLAQSAIRQMIKTEKEAARLQALWQYERCLLYTSSPPPPMVVPLFFACRS